MKNSLCCILRIRPTKIHKKINKIGQSSFVTKTDTRILYKVYYILIFPILVLLDKSPMLIHLNNELAFGMMRKIVLCVKWFF